MILLLSAMAAAQELSEVDEALLEARLPDPNTATLQSTVLGFGAGHFYAGNVKRGAIFAGLQVLSVAIGAYAYDNPGANLSGSAQSSLFAVGVWGLGLSRAGDILLAPHTAHQSSEAMIRAQYGQ